MNSHCVILLVEDDENDSFFVRRTLAKLDLPGKVEHVWDAESARRYLTSAKPFQDREQYPIPDLIITDLSLLERISGMGSPPIAVRGRAAHSLFERAFTGAA
jgi:CheY-like chemotaxis protein